MIRRGLVSILNVIFPIECIICKKEGEIICKDCFEKIAQTTTQNCPFCKKIDVNGKTCQSCRKNFHLDGIFSAGNYEQKELKESIKHLKYNFIKTLSNELSLFILKNLEKHKMVNGELFKGEFFLMPIPLSKQRERWRGFNQSSLLAEKIAATKNWQVLPGLIKKKNSKPQAKLSGQKRKDNLRECFEYNGENLNGKKIILIDDVVTTGATLEEAAKTLKKHGAKTVWGLVVAKG